MEYSKKVIRNGRITMGLAIIANFIPAIYVGLRYDVMPSWGTIFQIWGHRGRQLWHFLDRPAHCLLSHHGRRRLLYRLAGRKLR